MVCPILKTKPKKALSIRSGYRIIKHVELYSTNKNLEQKKINKVKRGWILNGENSLKSNIRRTHTTEEKLNDENKKKV